MAPPIPTVEPSRVNVGDSVQWDRLDLAPTFPSSEWDLNYYFNSRDPAANFVVNALAQGDGFRVTLSAVTTGAFTASDSARGQSGYLWVVKAEHQSDGRVFTIGQGCMDWLMDLASVTNGGFDPRTWAQIALENVRAVIQRRASSSQLSFTISNQTLELMTPDQLKGWYSWLSQEVKAADPAAQAQGGVPSKTARVTLSRGY